MGLETQTVPSASVSSMPRERKTIFVVGLGMVGIAFIEKLLTLDEAQNYRIVTCGEEVNLAYNRVALTDYFQHRSVEKLYLNQPDWYTSQNPSRFLFHLGEQVTSLDPTSHTITTSSDRTIRYDYCVLATGSTSALPSYLPRGRAKRVKGVFVYRNISDLDGILAYAESEEVSEKGGRAVIVGGGLLGLEAAKAAFDIPSIKEVTIINRQAYPLSRQLDKEGGEIVLRRIESMGVKVLTNTSVTDITTSPVTPSSPQTEASAQTEFLTGLTLTTPNTPHLPADMVIYAVGITPRSDLAQSTGIALDSTTGGIVVDDHLLTSAEDVYAIGECASWRGRSYGLIAPGVEMADILSFNFTQVKTELGGFRRREMNAPDLSTKLKLMGVDVASFGDYFADRQNQAKTTTTTSSSLPSAKLVPLPPRPAPSTSSPLSHDRTEVDAAAELDSQPKSKSGVWEIKDEVISSFPAGPSLKIQKEDENVEQSKKEGEGKKLSHKERKKAAMEGPVECLAYRDPFAGVYKKYIFTADGKYLLGGMMVGDTSDYVKLVALVKKKKPLEVPPSQFVLGAQREGGDDGADLDDDTQICSCHNVSKADIVNSVKSGLDNVGAIKAKTKAGTGCGGCLPLVTNIFKAEMKKAGKAVDNHLCPHFAMSRQELFSVIKIKKLKTFTAIMEASGVNKDSLGCEICKPTIGSILSSLFNEHIMDPIHHANQDTNDRYLANIQRNGSFSVVPRVAGGEITPDKLIALGQVAKKYGLYTKITGGQRIDLFGAQKQDLPDIWEELVSAGFESGHAYGKALRTVKSCVGTTWCRYGIGDSVGMAIQLEERYKGIRSPHKLKGGVSGCVRECAEAQSKDFGLIATDKGWNIFIAGNGGTTPRHATLFATDVPPSRVVRILDRFLMYYIRTADKLMRTARWVEQFEGGVERLKKILLEDELGICVELENEMAELVGTYACEWTAVVKDPARRRQFRQFVNTEEKRAPMEKVEERGQTRPANWPKAFPPAKIRTEAVGRPKEEWRWRRLAKVKDLMPSVAGTTSVAVRYGDSQLAIFHVPKKGYFATQQMCPHKRAFVLDHGIIGDDPNGNVYVSCPLHKRNFRLTDGECLNDATYAVMSFEVKEDESGEDVLVRLPDPEELDAVIGTSKWMVRRGTAEVVERGEGDGLVDAGCGGGSACGGGNAELDW